MHNRFANRMSTVHRSFIREILKVTADPSIISFAGGLPNPELFPMKEMAESAARVISCEGRTCLQYSTTEGDAALRGWIAERYRAKKGLDVDPESVLITTGSQQGLDLVAKVLLDKGDGVVIERPGYLGAIQSFSFFEPEFRTIALHRDGPDTDALKDRLADGKAKVFYAVPNFQNPSGISYSLEKRREVAAIMEASEAYFVEDDPYGELRFRGEHLPPVGSFMNERRIMAGSFSKIAAPGFRIGWLVASAEVRDKLVIAKQASDLHTATVAQKIVLDYLAHNDIDEHVAAICARYGAQAKCMAEAIARHFPEEVEVTDPEGGMFLWATLPEGCSSMALVDKALERKVAFVPGKPFYVDGSGDNSLRLNFSNADTEMIEAGISRLGACIKDFLAGR
ncbi:MAG: PLP-dependent aminotransferase family protein [Desulfovibrionaceae bacterium]